MFLLVILFQLIISSQSDIDTKITSPKAFLNYELGEKFSEHYQIRDYFEKLAAETKTRSLILDYGKTNQGRKLFLFIISSPENIKNLGKHEKANHELIMGKGNPATQKAFIWLGYGVHGNESSSSEAAMLTAYHLAADLRAETRQILDESIIIIDPMLNPDGRDRYVHWYKTHQNKNGNPDMNSVEHFEGQPSGRVNHYWFDLNRDWAFASQIETSQRLSVYHRFKPQVFVDFHEMGVNSSYFFFPAMKPINPYLPSSVIKWHEKFGKGNSDAFDKIARSYYTADDFDLFYPGYGDSYPTLNGAIGMTYEQSGGPRGGLIATRDDAYALSLKERITNHYRMSISTIQTAVKHKEELLRDFKDYYIKSLKDSEKSGFKYYILEKKPNAELLARILKSHHLKIFQADREQTASSRESGRIKILKGQFIIPIQQAQYILLRNLMDNQVLIPDTAFYDISAWSLPRAFNIELFTSNDELRYSDAPIEEDIQIQEADYAYAFIPNGLNSFQMLNALLDKQVKCRIVKYAFSAQGQTFPAGSILILNERNSADLYPMMRELSKKYRQEVIALQSGMVERGYDLGSNHSSAIPPIQIAILQGDLFSQLQVGALWNLFEEKLNIEVSRIDIKSFSRVNLNNYSTLIIPEDNRNGNSVKNSLSESGLQKLKNWIRESNGQVIFLGSTSKLAADAVLNLSTVKAVDLKSSTKSDLLYKDRMNEWNKNSFPGAFLRSKFDPSNPLFVGLSHPFYILQTSEILISKEKENPFQITSDGSFYGYLPETFRKNLSGTLLYEHGNNFTLFHYDPCFRMFTYGSIQLLLNSIFLGHAEL